MFKWLVVAFTLWSSPAMATGLSFPDGPMLEVKPKKAVDDVRSALGDEEEEEEVDAAAAARLAALEAQEGETAARVIVLRGPGTSLEPEDQTLQRNVRIRIARPNAKFFPDIDLYQSGRIEPDRTVRSIDQRASVPDDVVDRVLAAVREVESIPWNALTPAQWMAKAEELKVLADEIWFVDRLELREPLFLLYLQIGQAATNAGVQYPPWYEQISGQAINYYWYLAGAMAYETPALLSKVEDATLRSWVEYFKGQIESGQIQQIKLSFSRDGVFDKKKFTTQFALFINGREVQIDNDDGIIQVPRGRIDIYMARTGGGAGFSLSEKVDILRLDDKIYGVRDAAYALMGAEFSAQLMKHPNECFPDVDDRILASLAIYARLHKGAEVYVAVPRGGSANNVYLWRYDRPRGLLERVVDDTGGFPVRFAALIGAGMNFNGASLNTQDQISQLEQNAANAQPGADPSSFSEPDTSQLVKFEPAGVPIIYHLRGHYGRLMVTTGIEFAASIQGGWADSYQTRDDGPIKETVTIGYDDDGDPNTPPVDTDVEVEVLRELTWQRLVFAGVGVVLLKDAAAGLGPRGYLRVGWYNAPHALDLTGHVGITEDLPIGKRNGRVRPIGDADFFAGMMLPLKNTVYGKQPLFILGLTVSAGLTF